MKILQKAIENISPQLRAAIKEFILKWEITAKATPKPWDDLLVMIAKVIFDIE